MRINKQAADAARQEQASNRVVLPKGWYVAKILEAEDKDGNEKAKAVIIKARVKYDSEDGSKKTVKQVWRVNYVNRDGKDNIYGLATMGALIDATNADVIDDHCAVDQFEGMVVRVYLGVDESKDYINAQGKAVTQPKRNSCKDFEEYDAKAEKRKAKADKEEEAAKAATAALEAQAKMNEQAAWNKAVAASVDDHPFDDDIPF